jgi:dihydrofolate reductase
MIGIAAVNRLGGIGLNNKLPWPKVSDDLKFFKEITLNKNIIVGNTTYKHLPKLPNRYIKILTQDKNLVGTVGDNFEYFDLLQFEDLNHFLIWSEDDIVCGGAMVYNLLMPLCNEFYLTFINDDTVCDTYFPMEVFNKTFKNSELIKEIDGGHKIIKYSR